MAGQQDDGKAARHFLAAAEGGLPQARIKLAAMLYEGRGVARNPGKTYNLISEIESESAAFLRAAVIAALTRTEKSELGIND